MVVPIDIMIYLVAILLPSTTKNCFNDQRSSNVICLDVSGWDRRFKNFYREITYTFFFKSTKFAVFLGEEKVVTAMIENS